ncbi:hypothetical protein PMIN04_010716 [Paraphaeosphaeria minitans]
MALFINLFENPALLGPTQHTIETLQGHVRMVQGLERAKSLLKSGNPQDDFVRELAKLSLDELAVVSVAYPEQRLESIRQHFRAASIRSYIVSQDVKVSKDTGIHKRIAYYLKASRGTFKDLYSSASTPQPSPKS